MRVILFLSFIVIIIIIIITMVTVILIVITFGNDVFDEFRKSHIVAIFQGFPVGPLSEVPHYLTAIFEVEMDIVFINGSELVPVGRKESLQGVPHYHELKIMFEAVLNISDVITREVAQPQGLEVVLVVNVNLAVVIRGGWTG